MWRVLSQAGLLKRWKGQPSRNGTDFEQPPGPHQYWHIDVSYLNICGTFYYLCSVLDGYSRFLVHWDLRESKEFIRISGRTHVPSSPYYPRSNGKIERWHKSLKAECIRPGTLLSPEDARRLIQQYVDHYNTVRLHSAIGFVTPADMLGGRQAEIHAARDRKLEEAGRQRQLRRSRRREKWGYNSAKLLKPMVGGRRVELRTSCL